MTPLDTREWLEAMYRAGGPDADQAARALAELDGAGHRDELGDAAYELLVYDAGLTVGDDPMPLLRSILKQWQGMHKAARAAGLVAEDDRTTDPLPLIRMFLPA